MRDINQINIIGRLTKEVEIKYTTTGVAICNFSIANNESIKKNDKWEDYANFFDCQAFGNLADTCNKYLKKGNQVCISGSLHQDRWNDKTTNQARSKIVIKISDIQFLTKPEKKDIIEQIDPYQNNNNLGQESENIPF